MRAVAKTFRRYNRESHAVPIRRTGPSISLGISLALAALVAIVYAPASHFAFINYDDPDYVANPHVRAGLSAANAAWAFTSAYAANWLPLTSISHMIDRDLFGDRAGMHHLMNVAFHGIAALLVFAGLRRMSGALWRSAFAALIFALHPLHVESVAWVAERKDVLSGVFFFAAIWAYAIYAERPGAVRYAVVTLAVAGALLSKPTTVTLPVVFLLIDYWPLERGLKLAEKLPWIAMAMAASIVTYLVQRGAGAVAAPGEIPLAMRVENALVSYAVYLVKFFWPANLAVFYPYPKAIPVWQAMAAAVVLMVITAAVFRARRGYLVTGWLWFLITLLPMIGLVQAGLQSRADRYTYLALTGLSIMLVWGAAEVLEGRKTALVLAGAAAGAAAGVAMAAVTFLNLQNWRDSETLFRHAIAVTEGNYIAYNNLGVALRRSGRSAEAIPMFESAIAINAAYPEAQNNLGEALMAAGRPDDALAHVTEALHLDPNLADARVNFGSLLNKRGRFAEGAEEYRIALRLDPENAAAHAGLGIALTELGRYEEALPQLLEAERLDPQDADVHYNLGRLYGLAGRAAEAVTEFSEAVRLNPANREAHFNLGTALASENKMRDAEEQFRAALRLDPGYVNAHFNLASALANEGDYEAAIGEFSEVLRLDPNFAQARRGLEYCRQLEKRQF